MLSQRIYRQNPLAYPAGVAPGFGPTHMASAPGNSQYNGVFSCCALPNGNMYSVKQGTPGSITGTPTTNIDGRAGPLLKLATSASYLQFGNQPNVPSTVTQHTMAVIVGAGGASNDAWIVTESISNSNSGGFAFFWNAGTPAIQIQRGGLNISMTNYVWTAGHTYFVVVSGNASLVNFLQLDLVNGKIITQVVATGLSGGSFTTANTYSVGGRQGQALGCPDGIAAAMANINLYLSMPQLLQWAQSPWDFWYPQVRAPLMFSGLGPKIGAVSSVVFRRTFSPVGTRVGSRQSQAT
jgi:hypothetical protein